MKGFCSVLKINPNRTRIKRFVIVVAMLACSALVFSIFSLSSQTITPPFPTAIARISETKKYTENAPRIEEYYEYDEFEGEDYNIVVVDMNETVLPDQSDLNKNNGVDVDVSLATTIRMLKKKKKRDFPINSISEMNQLLVKARRSYRTMVNLIYY